MNKETAWNELARTQACENLDLSILKALEDFTTPGEQSLVKEVLQTYLEISPVAVDRIVVASHAADRATIRKQAHSLKSSSGNVGAVHFADICDQIEKRSSNEATPSELQSAAERLLSEFLIVRKGLETVLQCLD